MAEWRDSGLTSDEFCEGKDFTPGGLRNAASVGKGRPGRPRRSEVPLARVVQSSSPLSRTARALPPQQGGTGEVAVLLEIAGVRLAVRRGCDVQTLTAVLQAVTTRGVSR